jgi:hypothetical protein
LASSADHVGRCTARTRCHGRSCPPATRRLMSANTPKRS